MTIQYLKKGIAEQERSAENDKVKNIVEETLKKIEQQGDQYVRELSEKFDNYSPTKVLG
jgi:Histidinol dehydrogenase